MLRTILCGLAAAFAVGAASLMAQDSILSQLYGQGVHKYFARDYSGAFEAFNSAIENGSDDPRCYYFRGLTYLQLGREDEAKEDFKKGAELEMKSATKFFNVSRALQRIQGRQRLLIEEYRTQARLTVMMELEKQRRARYEELRREEARVLDRSAPPVGIPQVSAPAEVTPAQPAAQPAPPAPMEPAAQAPAATPPAPQATPPASPPQQPAAPPAPAQENPFSTEPAPAAPPQRAPQPPAQPPANENPFAT
ncbi:tetratricopeptide repeat protein [Thermogutta sp.]|uniref:tetratricopeptide repeat protein n=1 Tax=Thermogutta sp. TaxID=1962930 RepID=UPI003C7AC868